MTQKERLVELLKLTDEEYERLFYLPGSREYHITDEEFEFVAQHLLDNGVIVPPCKVGDTLYFLLDGEVVESEVVDFCISERVKHKWIPPCGFASMSNIGKSVFLTREEAEQALKERNDENTL